MQLRYFLLVSVICLSLTHCRWTQQEAAKWYGKYNWSAGFNYAPSYACNQIQMWESFNETTIDRELGWAEYFGFTKLRVFLHIGPFIAHQTQFLQTVQKFLNIAKKHKQHVIPVLFDDCWKPTYAMGKQPDPVPGLHNSQWVQCPGQVPVGQSQLQNYVSTIIGKWKNDQTIVLWDLYNQVGNSGYLDRSLPLLQKVFGWARGANPSQPLTSGSWNTASQFNNINHYILAQSDVITFHAYCDVACTQGWISRLEQLKRPVICTQYMARQTGSKFITHLPVFKKHKVWAINWGFVFGRTQTYYPWWSKEGDPVPELWFHDVIHTDGRSYDKAETDFIKNITTITAADLEEHIDEENKEVITIAIE